MKRFQKMFYIRSRVGRCCVLTKTISLTKTVSLPYNNARQAWARQHHFNTEGEIMQFVQLWIGLIAALIMAGGLGGIFYLVIKQNATLGNKTIQFLAIVFVLPLLLVLGIFNVLRSETIGPIIGVIVGFVLSHFSRE
jgi:hypothetical protein